MTQVITDKDVDKDLAGQLGVTADGDGPMWLRELRAAGREVVDELGLPTTDMEEWRQTNVGALKTMPLRAGSLDTSAAARALVDRFRLGKGLAAELVFVNGYFAPELSHMPNGLKGLRVTALADAFAEGDPLLAKHFGKHAGMKGRMFVGLNTAALADGAMIHLARGAVVERPIHLLFVTTEDGVAVYPRVLVVAEENSEATLVESYAGTEGAKYFVDAVTEIVVEARARLDHYKLQQEGREAWHVAAMQVELGREAGFVSHSISLGARLGRNDLGVIMGGEAAEATLNGLVVIDGEQHIDNHTLLDHAMPNCPSHELYKHVLGGRASGVFKGKILVRQDAQKTNSKQTSKCLLLTNEALMDAQPALEIYADDVKCTHGSTTGPVDEEMVFYLRSRGVSLEAARHLLTYAFAADITRRIKVDVVRERVETILAAKHDLPQDLRITDLAGHDEAVRQM